MADCELCKLVEEDINTHLYYQDSLLVIVVCNTCQLPMVVFRHHGEATEDEKRKAMVVIDELFNYINIRRIARKILDHEHFHIEGSTLRR